MTERVSLPPGGAGPGTIKVGTSGFSYPEWRGPFYPEGLVQQQMLAYYARHFPAVEINSTYYHIPTPRNMAAMAKRAEGRLEFAVKAHQDMTHSREKYADALPPFREAVVPLREAGALACVLVQFPFSFKATAANADFLRRIVSDLAPDPVVVEFRHQTWTTDETFALLGDLGAAYCCVDEPRLPNLPLPVVRVTGPIGYVRFHGRNRQKWWTHAEAWERYDYLYSEAELLEWVPKIRSLAEETQKCYAFFNNHARGQAVTNAQMLITLLSGPAAGTR
ncbi:MAG: DUF72 domain-containing protein [Candidatus Methylomirabilota bacterium]